jgi:hypothetical protein
MSHKPESKSEGVFAPGIYAGRVCCVEGHTLVATVKQCAVEADAMGMVEGLREAYLGMADGFAAEGLEFFPWCVACRRQEFVIRVERTAHTDLREAQQAVFEAAWEAAQRALDLARVAREVARDIFINKN